MKLLIVTPWVHRGGTEEYALTAAKGAIKAGWDVHAAFPNSPGNVGLAADFAELGVRHHSLELTREGNRVLQHIHHELNMEAVLRRVSPEIVLMNLSWPTALVGPLVACGRMRVPTVAVFHLVCKEINPILKTAMLWAKKRDQQWVAVSDYNSRIASSAFGIPADAIKTIYNGTTTNAPSSPELKRQTREKIYRELGLPENARTLLSVGGLLPQKGYHVLIPAIRNIVDENPDVRFIWAGEGPDRAKLQEMLGDHGVSDYVLMLGRRNDVPDLMLASDLFVFPTLLEGLPFVLLEAMAFGLPVVATAAASIPEVVEHRKHGVLCEPRSTDSLCEAVLWALGNRELMQQMAENAKERCKLFSREKMVNSMLAELQRVAERQKSA